MKSRLFDKTMLSTADQAVEFISSILESSTEYSIIAKSLEGTILLWNEGARRLYGYEAEEVVGIMNGSSLNAPEEVQNGKHAEIFRAALKSGKWEGVLRRIRKNGEEFLARVVVTPRMDSSGKPIGILLISKDISQEIRMTLELESTNNHLREQILQRQIAETALMQSHQELIVRSVELEQTASQMRRLVEMSDLLQSCASSDEARQVAEKALTKFFPAEAGTIYLASELSGTLETFASWNNANLALDESFGPQECWALRRGRPHIFTIDGAATRCAHVRDKKAEASICAPMSGQGKSLGVFHMEWREGDIGASSSRTENRQSLAAGVADIIALAISNVRLREALKDQTIHDPLTGLYNRRYLEDSLHREISRARRSGASVGFIMFDIDNFKRFNDTYGHQLGDQLLRALGNYLKALVRPEDIPCRYGGEEFTLVMPGASREIARERAEKARRGFQNLRLSDRLGLGNAVDAVTISAGVAVFPEHGNEVNQVLKAADEALYEAKRAGKDRVEMAPGNIKAAAREFATAE